MSDFDIRIKGGIVVTVPRAIGITTWVVLEQEDWFEKEVAFLRRWLKPGMRTIDIGANFGIYALSMAKLVAPGGAVWAFEPSSEPATLLQKSAARNGLSNLRLIQMALSNHDGTAPLYRNGQSELNSLVHVYESGAVAAETVMVSSLDSQQAALGWGPIDFVKIDAEGACADILAGGAGFFAEQSPLVMFEANDSRGDEDRAALPTAFRGLGFDVYRLVGPDTLLAPIGPLDQLTGFDLNLFACKSDRAAQLSAAGLLVQSVAETVSSLRPGGGVALFERQSYARCFGALKPRTATYVNALDAYAVWRDPEPALVHRYAALRRAFAFAQEAVKEKASIARVSTLARVAWEAGERQFAIDMLPLAMKLVGGGDAPPPDEPFFPPSPRYDTIGAAGVERAWLLAATAEALETWEYFAGCFRPVEKQQLEMFDWLQSSPFASAPMERRRQLQRWHAGLPRQLPPILAQASPDNLNPELWVKP